MGVGPARGLQSCPTLSWASLYHGYIAHVRWRLAVTNVQEHFPPTLHWMHMHCNCALKRCHCRECHTPGEWDKNLVHFKREMRCTVYLTWWTQFIISICWTTLHTFFGNTFEYEKVRYRWVLSQATHSYHNAHNDASWRHTLCAQFSLVTDRFSTCNSLISAG